MSGTLNLVWARALGGQPCALLNLQPHGTALGKPFQGKEPDGPPCAEGHEPPQNFPAWRLVRLDSEVNQEEQSCRVGEGVSSQPGAVNTSYTFVGRKRSKAGQRLGAFSVYFGFNKSLFSA